MMAPAAFVVHMLWLALLQLALLLAFKALKGGWGGAGRGGAGGIGVDVEGPYPVPSGRTWSKYSRASLRPAPCYLQSGGRAGR